MSRRSDKELFDEWEGCDRCTFRKKPSTDTCKGCKSGDRRGVHRICIGGKTMSDDLIKRSDAIKAVRDSRAWHFMDIIPVLSALKDIPSADRPQGWIPCSERLPNEYVTVLVTWEYEGKSYTTTAYRKTQNAVTYWKSDDEFRYTPLNVLAWMPLPEPWKGADDADG